MQNKYKIGLLTTALNSSLLVSLPTQVFAAEILPPVCTKQHFDPWACYWLEGKITEGMCGEALRPDIPRIQAAAEQGKHAAAYRLGQLYSSATWGVKRDYRQAHYWFERGAIGGNRDAQVELARQYEFGRGVKRDLQQALHWYEQAVSQGPYKGLDKKINYLLQKTQIDE
ncbi:tetratricopeptide repeat protein [Sulfuriflexus mobilis]|uniref:tetratricopeptide repeat protein n=1 Tax=Sulfuriflexus mobilis TaxID=1811807 RepID=UPI000F8171D4|nr:tetratricopeptide repeat protein [Sulfuriflexus mobilis]